MSISQVDVLVVGAGPTGLALALELIRFGVRPRIVDRRPERTPESRALGIQPRTLEVLAPSGAGEVLAAAGNPNVDLRIHARGREVEAPLYDLGLTNTAYPYLLFLSQAETERILEEHLATAGVTVERNVELVDLESSGDADLTRLRHGSGPDEEAAARYVLGCDGAASTVRSLARIPFEGSTYPQTFVLADTEAEGIEEGVAHVFLTERGMLFFFPLVTPAAWRILVMRPPDDPTPPEAPVTLREVQALIDANTDESIRLWDPVWMTNFRIHHRAATHYRASRVFIAGDASHVHSPAGAQGMNTGIQDGVNLAWKLAYTLKGAATALLDTYELERAPIGRQVLSFTDRAFKVATSTSPIIRFLRTRMAPTVIGLALRPRAVRSYAFRTVSQLAIHYRDSPLSTEGPQLPSTGPRAGDRLPDTPLVNHGEASSLHQLTAGPSWHLLLCGPNNSWSSSTTAPTVNDYGELVTVHQLGTPSDESPHPDQQALSTLGLRNDETAQYLIRPDGHIGYRSAGNNLKGAETYLDRWHSRA